LIEPRPVYRAKLVDACALQRVLSRGHRHISIMALIIVSCVRMIRRLEN
jgi:hypothetical protein